MRHTAARLTLAEPSQMSSKTTTQATGVDLNTNMGTRTSAQPPMILENENQTLPQNPADVTRPARAEATPEGAGRMSG